MGPRTRGPGTLTGSALLWSGGPSELVGCLFLFQAEVAQLQEQVALKDAEIERLHSQLSRSAALHSDHAEKGNWLGRDRVQSPLGLGSHSYKWACESLGVNSCVRRQAVCTYVCVCLCVHTRVCKAQLPC